MNCSRRKTTRKRNDRFTFRQYITGVITFRSFRKTIYRCDSAQIRSQCKHHIFYFSTFHLLPPPFLFQLKKYSYLHFQLS